MEGNSSKRAHGCVARARENRVSGCDIRLKFLIPRSSRVYANWRTRLHKLAHTAVCLTSTTFALCIPTKRPRDVVLQKALVSCNQHLIEGPKLKPCTCGVARVPRFLSAANINPSSEHIALSTYLPPKKK